jgi:endonuclease YncB( thermonuclease family)
MARYNRRHTSLGATLLSIVLFGLYLVLQPHSSLKQAIVNNDPGLYTINHFVDGDTIAVNMNGSVEKVRFIGIDTPETHKPNTPVQCYGPAAAAFTKATIGSQKVKLIADSQSTNRDKYNRLLRYVYLPDGTDVNELLVTTGHAFYYPYFPFTKSDQFAADQAAAKAANLGLWGNCSPVAKDGGGYVSNNQ